MDATAGTKKLSVRQQISYSQQYLQSSPYEQRK